MSETQEIAAPSEAQANPLLKPWQTPFETPPFAEIQPEHFLPAFEQAFADHAAEIAAITHDPAAPDFATVAAGHYKKMWPIGQWLLEEVST